MSKCSLCKSQFKNNICDINCRNFNISLYNLFGEIRDFNHIDCRFQNQEYFIREELLKNKDKEKSMMLWAKFYNFAIKQPVGNYLEYDNSYFNHVYE